MPDKTYNIELRTTGDTAGAEAVEEAIVDTAAAIEQADAKIDALQKASADLRENGLEEVAEALEAVGEKGGDAAEQLTEAAIKSRDLNSVATILRQAGLGPLADALTLVTRTTDQVRVAKQALATQALTTGNIVRTAFLSMIPVVGLVIGAVTGLVAWFRRTKDEAAEAGTGIDDLTLSLRRLGDDARPRGDALVAPLRRLNDELDASLEKTRTLARAQAELIDAQLANRLLDIDEAEQAGDLAPLEAERERTQARRESADRIAELERQNESEQLERARQELAATRDTAATIAKRIDEETRRSDQLDALIEANNERITDIRARLAQNQEREQAARGAFGAAMEPREARAAREEISAAAGERTRLEAELQEAESTRETQRSLSAAYEETQKDLEKLRTTRSELLDQAEKLQSDIRRAEQTAAARAPIDADAEAERRRFEERMTEQRGRANQERAEADAARQREAAERAAAEAEAAAATVAPTVPGDDPAIGRLVAVVETLVEDQRQRGAGDRPAVAALENIAAAVRDGATGDELTTAAAAIEQAMQTFATSTTANNAALRSLAAKVDNLQRQVATQAAR